MEKEQLNKKIEKLATDINKNFFLLGKYLYEIYVQSNYDIDKIDFAKLNISKYKGKEIIENYKFALENNIDYNISFSKLSLIRRIKDKKLKEEAIKKANEMNYYELKNFIDTKEVKKIKRKTFEMDEDDLQLFENAKKIVENIIKEKPTNSQTLRYILADFVSSNIDYL